MKKYLILIFCFFCGLLISAQRLETQKILEVADSILLANTNKKLFDCFKISVGSYYKYQDKNRLTTGKFLNKKKLNSNVKEIGVLYFFIYPDIEDIKGGVWVKLDYELKLIEPVELDFIPKFVWDNRPSDFITKQKALKQGISYFRNEGIAIREPYLEYDKKLKLYTYTITNILTREKDMINGRDVGNAESVKINAYTGELLDIQEYTYGLIIR